MFGKCLTNVTNRCKISFVRWFRNCSVKNGPIIKLKRKCIFRENKVFTCRYKKGQADPVLPGTAWPDPDRPGREAWSIAQHGMQLGKGLYSTYCQALVLALPVAAVSRGIPGRRPYGSRQRQKIAVNVNKTTESFSGYIATDRGSARSLLR